MQPSYELDVTTSKLRDDLGKIVRDVERLLDATVHISDERLASTRARVEHALEAASLWLGDERDSLATRAQVVNRRTDEYAHSNPWTVIGATAVIAFLVGYLIGRR